MATLRAYYWLTKPGIVYGNALSTVAGFFLASKGDVDWWLLIAVLVGTSLIIACGCVFNNYTDRSIDAKMARTKGRALVKKSITNRRAILYGITLGLLGFSLLALYANLLTVGVGLLGLFFYLVMYGIWKRRSPFGTVVGSVSGATPPVAGYVAVTNQIDGGALLLFLVLTLWQMPHFYAIAMFRAKEYAAASIPVLPLMKGMHTAKVYILWYIVAFTAASLMLTFFGYTGYVFAGSMLAVGIVWFWGGLSGLKGTDDTLWARKVFFSSLVVLVLLSLLLSLNILLP